MTSRYVCLTVLGFFLATGIQAQQRVPARIDNSKTVTLAHRVHPLATPANDRGAVSGDFALSGMSLILKPTAAQQQDLSRLLAQQQDPSSPNYHKWLTPEQYADRFGVSADDLAKVTAWLESQGFHIANVARGRTFILFDGTAAQARTAFHTEIHHYSVNGVSHYANSTDPAIPADLAPIVGSIRGLSDFRLKPRLKPHANPQSILSGGQHYLSPNDFAAIYNVAPLYSAGIDGTGQKLAIVGQTAINLSDITKFRTNMKLPPINLTQMLVKNSSTPGISNDDLPEADLDIEWSSAVAPNANIIYVYSTDVFTSMQYAIDNDVAPVISMSYGGCELWDLAELSSTQQMAQRANVEGITWITAAGDSGAGDCEDQGALVAQDGLSVDVPGSIPEVTSMGGTVLSDGASFWSASGSAQGYMPEGVWNDTSAGAGLASGGGGASIFFPQPAWQTGSGVPNDGVRHVPDISLSASNEHVPYYVYSGSVNYYGGTSAAAPTMAGIVTLLNQYLVQTNSQAQPGLGNINPALYRLAQTNPDAFHDVTTGNNSVPCVAGSPNCTNGFFGYDAVPGYDMATGLGSVDAYNLVHAWSSSPVTASAVTVSIDQNPVFEQASSKSWQFTLTLTEEAGVATKLTSLSINGADYSSLIAGKFGGGAIAANGSVTGTISLSNVNVPSNVLFGFNGVDASDHTWTYTMAIPFSGPQTHISVAGVSNAASGQQVFAPGMILSVYGAGLGNWVQSAGSLPLPQFLGGFEATINGVTAPIYYVSPNQVNIQIPYETSSGIAILMVGNPWEESPPFRFRVAAAGPGIFTFQDGSINPSNNAKSGDVATLFVTGDGQVTPKLATGAAPSPRLASAPKPTLPVTVTVGGVVAATQFIGVPTWGVGITQINFQIPDGLSKGPQPVVVTVGSAVSQTATITIQ